MTSTGTKAIATMEGGEGTPKTPSFESESDESVSGGVVYGIEIINNYCLVLESNVELTSSCRVLICQPLLPSTISCVQANPGFY
jgi:hypothetical protein